MTTIILTTLGILLAAVSALMIIYYGGDMFQTGTTSAQANAYMNAGHNVMAASDQYRMQNHVEPPSLDELVSSGYFVLPEQFSGRMGLSLSGIDNRFTITEVEPKVCADINRTLGRPDVEWANPASNANDGSGKMGCQLSGSTGTFYVMT